MRSGPVASLALTLLAGCGVDAEVEEATLELVIPRDPTCGPPGAVTRLLLTALGDFPAEGTATDLMPGPTPEQVDGLPPSTRMFSVRATAEPDYDAAGVYDLVERGAGGRVLVLPLGRACELAEGSGAPPDAAVAALPDGGLLVAGGAEERDGRREPVRTVRILAPGDEALAATPTALLNPRGGASATRAGAQVLIAGGRLPGDAPTDTFEVVDLAVGDVAPGRAGALTAARADHGAALLPDGRVLLVGGIGPGGVPLSSAETLSPADGVARAVGDLPAPRVAPQVVVLDDGTVLVLGGAGAEGGHPPQIYGFDPATDTFTRVEPATVPGAPGARAVPLPGARLLWLRSGEAEAQVLRRRPPYAGATVVERADLTLPAALDDLTGAALPDGTALITGTDAAGTPRAFVLDPGTGLARERRAPDAAPARAVALADGAVALLRPDGAALRRDVLRTAFDDPPATLFFGERRGLAFDLPDRWRQEAADFVATMDAARVDVPALRFADLSLELDATGPLELLLIPEGAPPAAVLVRDDLIGLPLCEVARAPGASVVLERRGRDIHVSAGAESRTCAVDGLGARIGIALRASAGARVRALRLSRLRPRP